MIRVRNHLGNKINTRKMILYKLSDNSLMSTLKRVKTKWLSYFLGALRCNGTQVQCNVGLFIIRGCNTLLLGKVFQTLLWMLRI